MWQPQHSGQQCLIGKLAHCAGQGRAELDWAYEQLLLRVVASAAARTALSVPLHCPSSLHLCPAALVCFSFSLSLSLGSVCEMRCISGSRQCRRRRRNRVTHKGTDRMRRRHRQRQRERHRARVSERASARSHSSRMW